MWSPFRSKICARHTQVSAFRFARPTCGVRKAAGNGQRRAGDPFVGTFDLCTRIRSALYEQCIFSASAPARPSARRTPGSRGQPHTVRFHERSIGDGSRAYESQPNFYFSTSRHGQFCFSRHPKPTDLPRPRSPTGPVGRSELRAGRRAAKR